MFENFVYALPELILICGLIVLPVLNFFNNSQKQTLKLSAWIILFSWFMNIIFYNKSFSEHYFVSTGFSTLVSSIAYLGSFAVLILARRWYASTGEAPLVYCEGILLGILLCNIATESVHFAVTVLFFWGMLGVNILMLHHSSNSKDIGLDLKSYGKAAIFFSCIMLFIAFTFYLDNGHLAYSSLSSFISAKQNSVEIFLLTTAVILCYLFLLGLAPFSFWKTETTGQVILPVLAYFLLIPFASVFASFINLSRFVFSVYLEDISFFCLLFGSISMLIGALGACSGKNIHKILAYGSLFHLGIMFLTINSLTSDAIDDFLMYLLIYLLSMYGIVSAFFGLKSKGEYLLTLSDLAGSSVKKPYISAMITVYLFSLVGFPPFLGFVGLYTIGLNLASDNHFYILLFLLVILIILTYAYMQIIKTMYFEKSNNSYDHTERSIYAVVFINALLMIIISLKPDILIENIKILTENVFG